MKLKTAEQLSDQLSNELGWRKKELSEVKSLVETKSFSDSKHKVLVRSGICLLYAHWEGFVKLAANSYLEFESYRDSGIDRPSDRLDKFDISRYIIFDTLRYIVIYQKYRS